MEFWFSELHSPHVKFDIRVEKQLFSGESDYQRIDVFQSPEFGKFLTLNGSVIFSEQDCFIYNEMVVHVPMSVHPDVKNVLIIGGGDGGVSKELLQYDNIENIDIVEQDNMFVDVCREYFPETAAGLEDERVHIYNSDALRFLRSKQDMYDLIINDATDPFGASEGRQDTGCLDLLQRNIIHLRILSRQSGREEIYIQNITQLIFIQVHSCCQSMLKNY